MFAVSDLVTDLRQSRYVQFWFALWLIALALLVGGLIIFATQARQNRKDLSYRLHLQHVPSMSFPNFQFEVLNSSHVEFDSIQCGSASKKADMVACPGHTLKDCQQTSNTTSFEATFDRNAFSCSFNLKSLLPPDQFNQTNFVFAFSIVGNTENKNKLFVQPADNIEIYLERVVEEELGRKPLTKFIVTPIYVSSHQTSLGHSNITISYNTFDIKHWVQYDSYSSWNALADLGGLLFFIWLAHSFLMFIVELIFTRNDSRLFSSPSYSTV